MNLKELGEFNLIKHFTQGIPIVNSAVVTGIGDDAAVIRCGAKKFILFTTDSLIENIHFSSDLLTPYQVGEKAMAVNLSDIAAMGGIPKYAVVSVALTPETSVTFVNEVYRGIKKVAARFAVAIVGGDTARSPEGMMINISLLGEVTEKFLVHRSGAKAGDEIFVTGHLGATAAARLAGKHIPTLPLINEGREIIKKFKPTSMIDISDGLSSDIMHICEASRVGAKIYEEAIPISDETRITAKKIGKAPLKLALEGGEDYQLLFTAAAIKERHKGTKAQRHKEEHKSTRAPITNHQSPITNVLGVSISKIGEISKKKELLLIDKKGNSHRLFPAGYDHFSLP
ncbi:MAG: Thiamine-monophosphate kinase [Syntrophomonadaceae bacterium]|nr:Thiamine-monophosphate kinase [Bacillota bacterium]MBT9146836.1 Thiamine-monophosphate kinase [Bacillota bacterium]